MDSSSLGNAFQNEANTLYLAHRRDEEWRTYRVTPSWGDYFGTALAQDETGRVHVIWSEYREDRWRLVSRAFDPRSESWGADTYIAPEGNRQYFPVAVTASDGTAWVAWQEFRGDDLDVMAAWHDGSGWSAPTQVSDSDANDWAPDLAAAPDGSVWVAWDSYETGSYDILVRRLRPGRSRSCHCPAVRPEPGDRAIDCSRCPQSRLGSVGSERFQLGQGLGGLGKARHPDPSDERSAPGLLFGRSVDGTGRVAPRCRPRLDVRHARVSRSRDRQRGRAVRVLPQDDAAPAGCRARADDSNRERPKALAAMV